MLDKVAKSMQPAINSDLRNIYVAPNRAAAETAIDIFVEKYGVKYRPPVECLIKDRSAMLAFYDSPAGTGRICARRIQSRASLPRSGTGLCERRERYRHIQQSCWSSSLSAPHLKPGDG